MSLTENQPLSKQFQEPFEIFLFFLIKNFEKFFATEFYVEIFNGKKANLQFDTRMS